MSTVVKGNIFLLNKKAFCSQNARAERGCDSNNFLTRECASPGGPFCFIGIAKQFPIK